MRHSATQNTNISTLSMKLIQRISFFILLSIKHVTTLTILYIKRFSPIYLKKNCGSLGSKFDDFENYISSLTFQFDIIALSETWLKADTNIALYQLNDYNMYRLDRICRKGGGVAIYVKNTFKHRLLNQMTYVVNDLLKCLSIELTDQNNNKNIVTCLYRPPDSSIDDFINNIEKLFRNKQRKSMWRFFIFFHFYVEISI